MAGSKGLVLMAPPAGNTEAQKTLAGMLSAIKPKTKVGAPSPNVQLIFQSVLHMSLRRARANHHLV
jgi:hypothetical protein